jgi:uncharacterized protein (DUF1800 family)
MLPPADHSWTILEAAHLLNRAGFGGSPGAVRGFHALGREKAVDSLVAPVESLDSSPPLPWTATAQVLADRGESIAQQKTLREAMRQLPPEQAEEKNREFRKKVRQKTRERSLEAQAWWFRRMLTTQAPLREKMTLFWHDHFASSVQKVKQPLLMVQQNELFRSAAFGSFKDLTKAILLDPAMSLYLDAQNSRKDMPNENFPRELMELFTLGEGHYTEQDIREAARAFTGYQLRRAEGNITHNKRQWDSSDKTIFGKTGPFTGEDVIDLIFTHKQAARFISKKLWEFFVHENPATTIVDSLTTSFQRENFQVTPLLREIFLSKEFYSETSIRSQIKAPVPFLIGLLKQLEITDPPTNLVATAGNQLGQVLFAPPNVAGWDWGKAWINTNTLLTRYNLAGFLTKGAGNPTTAKEKRQQPGVTANSKNADRDWNGPNYEIIAPRPLRENSTELVDLLIFRFFQAPLTHKARESFIKYANSKKGAIFTNKETAELCHLMLSTPYYQLT